MSIFSNTALAFSMSADAFAASVSKGVTMDKPKWREAINIGLVFGAIETVTPIIGWLLGLVASSFITSYDHWIAFLILGILGVKMITDSLHKEDTVETEADEEARNNRKWLALILTAIGTSIDAMAIGVTLALLEADIWIAALSIGAATCLMATIGIMIGHYIGVKGGKIAEALGGIGLIIIGTSILYDHLDVM